MKQVFVFLFVLLLPVAGFATPKNLGVTGSYTIMSGANIENGTYYGSNQAVTISGLYYHDQFIFRSGITPLVNDGVQYNDFLMGWVKGTNPEKPRLCIMGGGTVKTINSNGSTESLGGVTGCFGVAIGVLEATMLFPNFTVTYFPEVKEIVWQGRVEVGVHVLKALIGGEVAGLFPTPK